MGRFLSIIFCVFWVTMAQAQLLPIELDQTITLPVATDVWDVMPHPDGYYVWVAAIDPDTEQTRIYWGRTDVEGFDSLDLNVGAPIGVTCFWREEYEPDVYEPFIALCSRRYFYNFGVCDRTLFRVYRLADGEPDSAQWVFSGDRYRHIFGYFNYDRLNFRPVIVAPYPPAPSHSSQIALLVAFSDHSWGSAHGYSYDDYSTPCYLIRDMLTDSTGQVAGLSGSSNYGAWTATQDILAISYFGVSGGCSWSPWGGSCSSSSAVRPLLFADDSLMTADPSWSCSEPGSYSCHSGRLALTSSAEGDALLHIANYDGETWGMVTSPGNGQPVWIIPGPYNFVLAANVLGDAEEEFLAYSNARHEFEIFGAEDGNYYGVSSQIGLLSSEARVIGRYDSTTRRIAWRTGAQDVRLYRFGEYSGDLAAVMLAHAGPPDWGYQMRVLDGEISRIVFSRLCSGTTGSVSGPEADRWTISQAADSIVFECSPPAIGMPPDTFFLHQAACQGTIQWQAGMTRGVLAGPYQPMQVVWSGPPLWAYHLELSGVVSQLRFWPMCSGVTAYVSGPQSDRWSVTIQDDSVVFVCSPPIGGLVQDTFFLSHPICDGTTQWAADVGSGTVAGPYQSSHSVTLRSIAAQNVERGIRISFQTAAEHDVVFYEVWKTASLSVPFGFVATLPSQGESDSLQRYFWLDEDVSGGTYYFYFILDEDIFGLRTQHRDQMVGTLRDLSVFPLEYSLIAYPNPFNSMMSIRFSTSRQENIQLRLFNIQGRLAGNVTDQRYEPGRYAILFDGSALPSGIYLLHMVTGEGFVATRKVVLLK